MNTTVAGCDVQTGQPTCRRSRVCAQVFRFGDRQRHRPGLCGEGIHRGVRFVVNFGEHSFSRTWVNPEYFVFQSRTLHLKFHGIVRFSQMPGGDRVAGHVLPHQRCSLLVQRCPFKTYSKIWQVQYSFKRGIFTVHVGARLRMSPGFI